MRVCYITPSLHSNTHHLEVVRAISYGYISSKFTVFLVRLLILHPVSLSSSHTFCFLSQKRIPLGAPSLALQHYRLMNVKQVQTDTLSHFILARASTYALCSTGDLTWQQECLESSHIYISNSSDVRSFTFLHTKTFITKLRRLRISLSEHSLKKSILKYVRS